LEIIKLEDIEKNIGINIDPVGFLFRYNGKIYRAIYNDKKEDVLFLFKSGAIDELNSAGLIPETKISDLKLEDYELVLEHGKIDAVIYPTEWSFNMLKDAALLVLNVNMILNKYGFETQDSHPYNILYHYSNPKFIDIGSFGRKRSENYWSGGDNFREFYYYPLKMWSYGNVILSKQFLINEGKYQNNKDYEFFIYKYSHARLLPSKYLERFFFYLKYLRNIQKYKVDEIRIVKKEKIKRKILKVLMFLSKAGLLPNNHSNFNKLKRKIKRITPPSIKTEWGEYHTSLYEKNIFADGTRFGLIIEQIKKLNPQSVLEIAGNQGLLAKEISKFVDIVICSDIDEKAVDKMYQLAKRENAKIYPMLLDFLSPINQNLYYADNLSVFKRLKSDVVLALALTHHLILTRKTPIENIFEALSLYTNKYLFIEFMPFGLRDGNIPSWYNINWFRKHFLEHYKLILEIPSENDGSRILFIGEKIIKED